MCASARKLRLQIFRRQTAVERSKTNFAQGPLLLRYSGTEPLARVMIEGERQREIENYAEKIAAAIKREIGA
jgi:phosphoglucosamine mutase